MPLVPFHADKKIYTPDDFHTLPADYVDLTFEELLRTPTLKIRRPDCINEFLQSWLFFSLLAIVVNAEVNSDDFLTGEDTLSTKKLGGYIKDWRRRQGGVDHRQPTLAEQNRYIRASMALADARRFMNKHCSYEPMDYDGRSSVATSQDSTLAARQSDPVYQSMDKKMLLSIVILGETLQDERIHIKSHSEGRLEFWKSPEAETQSWGSNEYVHKELLKNGCCKSEIKRRESTLPEVRLVYYSTFVKPTEKLNHDGCSDVACMAQKPMKYAKHMNTSSCNESRRCSPRGLEDTEINSIIAEGKTPLVTWTRGGQLDVKPYDLNEPDIKFGALSHSWEHGLLDSGRDARDQNDGKLLACQLEVLQDMFDKLIGVEQAPFWVDALCFPRRTAMQESAVNQMKDIYKRASAVLVWDKSLLEQPVISKEHMIQMNMRIRLGDWSFRLWTLQEAVLAPNLYVAFENGTLSLKDLLEGREAAVRDHNHPYHYVWRAGHPFSSAVWELRQPRGDLVARAWEAVQFRGVTESEDETLVLASVLKLDAKELEKIGNHSDPRERVQRLRMVKFLNMLDQSRDLGIPSGIIFLPPPSLACAEVPETEAYGWAPRSWLSKQSFRYPLFPDKPGQIGLNGLYVDFPGVILHCPNVQIPEQKFWIPVHQSMHKWYKVYADPEKPWPRFWAEDFCSDSEPSIILPTIDVRERWEIGVLVRTKGILMRGTVRWVKKLCRVWVRLETDRAIIENQIKVFREDSNRMIFGTRLPATQRWCIQGNF